MTALRILIGCETSGRMRRAMAWRCNVGWILLQLGEARA